MLDASFFDEPVDRRNTGSLKWDKYRGRDVIPMWVADMDFRSPPEVVEALRRRVDHGVFGYTLPTDVLVACVVAGLKRCYDWTIQPDWLVWLAGVVPGLHVVCRAVGDDGDDVLTMTPIYPPFLKAPELSRRRTVTVPMIESGGRWVNDLDQLEKSIGPRARLLLLCNPQNPTGRAFSREELAALADIAERRNLVLCSDEIHCGTILDPQKRHVPAAMLSPAAADRTITLMAPSKTYNIAGLHCSFAVISNAGLRRRFNRVMDGIVPGVNALGLTAALAAYRDGCEWHRGLVDYLRGNRDLLERRIREMPGLRMNHVEATYLAWIDARGLGGAEPVKFFEDAGVGLSSGDDFGLNGFLRLNFGCPRRTLNEALDRMRKAVEAL